MKNKNWRNEKITKKQKDYLLSKDFGHHEIPKTKGEASDLISEIIEDEKKEYE